MEKEPTSRYTFNMHTHYTVQFKDTNCTWIGQEDGKVKYHTSIASAEAAIKETFADVHQHRVEEATIIQWNKTPIAVKKNNKQFIESTACCYDVEYQYETCPDNLRPLWKVRRSNLETLEEARGYIKDLLILIPEETFRIVKREMTSKHSVVE